MRSWTKRQPRAQRARDRSRFSGGSSSGSRDLIRYRRNRESFWREISTVALWIAIAIMLFDLAGTLNTVSIRHLAEKPVVVRLAFPGIAIGAALFCLWRTRNAITEIRDIRREQRELTVKLRSEQRDESNTGSA